jgi:ankyrin repeat protein
VLRSGDLVKLLDAKCPQRIGIICGNATRFLTTLKDFTIDPNSQHVTAQWLNAGAPWNGFEPGGMTIRAIFTPLAGRLKAGQLKSNDLTISILQPQGRDAEAYEFITARESVDMGGAHRFGPGFMHSGLIRNGGSHHGRPVHEYFLKNYGDSVYADYVRYTLAIDSRYRHRDSDAFVKSMNQIIDQAPKDFPLLADTYADLLQHYRHQGEADRMETLCRMINLAELPIVNPNIKRKITWLVDYFLDLERRISSDVDYRHALLRKAAKYGHRGTVRFLIAKGADANAALHSAASGGQKEVAEILIANGADVNVANTRRRTALHSAASAGQKEVAEILIANGININAIDNCRRTPLHWAITSGKTDIVRLLIANAADVNIRDHYGWTPLYSAVHGANNEMVQLLIASGANLNTAENSGRTPLIQAIRHGRVDIARLLTVGGADVNIADRHGCTPLYWAVSRGDKEIAGLLLENGAKVNTEDDDYKNHLRAAIRKGHREIADLLRKHSAVE